MQVVIFAKLLTRLGFTNAWFEDYLYDIIGRLYLYILELFLVSSKKTNTKAKSKGRQPSSKIYQLVNTKRDVQKLPNPSGSGYLLSLFCGAGGLDLGFEDAGFKVGLAYDLREDGIHSYNKNRPGKKSGHVFDVRKLTLEVLDQHYGHVFKPRGIIGGPPCQSFSRATFSADNDPRHTLPLQFSRLVRQLNKRNPLDFFVFENVPGLLKEKHKARLKAITASFKRAGFNVFQAVLNAADYGVPQRRERLILVGLNKERFPGRAWHAPTITHAQHVAVEKVLKGLPRPKYFKRGLTVDDIKYHPNHWCMAPKSKKFKAGTLKQGTAWGRSFRTLKWSLPSPTVAYGNREVHIHPNCKRRLSVFEAMRLQGFPDAYILTGDLSSQITQVSEAVPPPLAKAIAASLGELIYQPVSMSKKAA